MIQFVLDSSLVASNRLLHCHSIWHFCEKCSLVCAKRCYNSKTQQKKSEYYNITGFIKQIHTTFQHIGDVLSSAH